MPSAITRAELDWYKPMLGAYWRSHRVAVPLAEQAALLDMAHRANPTLVIPLLVAFGG